MTRVAYLDGWRGLAVLAVLFAHFGTYDVLNGSRFGVEMFFVLSGRLMAEILFVQKTALPAFYWRRFSRIFPALAVMAGLMVITAFLRGGDPTGAQFLATITFTTNYFSPWVGRSPVLDHIWSLCIEEHSYLLLGALAWFHRRYDFPILPVLFALVAAAILVGAAQTMAGADYYAVYWLSHVRGASIFMGAIAFLWHRQAAEWPDRTWDGAWRFLPLALFLLALLLNVNVVPDPIKYSVGTACLAAALVLLPRAPEFVLSSLQHPLVVRIGLWSYSLYLWQQPFYKMGGAPLTRLALLGVTFVVAYLSYKLVEQPARRWLNRHTQPKQENG